jgi:hypothetical protein
MSPRSKLSLNQKLILLLTLLGVLVAIFAAFISGHDWFTNERSIQEIEYRGRVIDSDSQQLIVAAKVTLDFEGTPYITYTDSEGLYQFKLAINSESIGTLRVDAKGFQIYIRNISISPAAKAIEDIRLIPRGLVVTYSVEIPTETPLPTIAPNPTQTNFQTTFAPDPTFTNVPTVLYTVTSTPVIILPRDIPMVLIPAGFFDMYGEVGSSKVYVNEFYIDQHEVTNGEYRKCVDVKACSPPYEDADEQFANVVHFGNSAYENYPIVLVSWNMAQNYCRWRGGDTRLPTEVEWEKAARGTLSVQTYPWGNTPPVCSTVSLNGSNFSDCGTRDAVPIAIYLPNGYGIYDMAGNIAEWVDKDMPNAEKMIRGGSWYDSANHLSVYSYVTGKLLDGYVNVGFRCAKSAP